MDKSLRNTLRNVVTQCRRLLEEAVAEVLEGLFGIYASGKIEAADRMGHLSADDREYREQLLVHLQHIQAAGFKTKEAVEQLVREVAFTHLNRFCAYKMMETRSLIRKAVSDGLKSQGFLFYLADYPEEEQLYNEGKQDVAYRHFLEWLGGTLSEEIGVLFSPHDPANRLLPTQRVLDSVLELLNSEELKDIWVEDETIGWVYQYFTPKELRDKARKESQAPRNSYELAFRNQFYTPSYVVQFLTDNTLGRIWYEMRKGETVLKEQCQYLVQRPNEVFLAAGEQAPQTNGSTEDLSEEELLKQLVYIPHRPKKDPRSLTILDPACGSGHFLLYCFTLLLIIYEEAYDDSELGSALQQDYSDREEYRKAVPGLILAHNLHGIDIDLRATQIAALALWLRAQKVYQEMGIKKNRPKITKSNIVCAEPMPGEKELLDEFVAELQPRVLGQLVRVVFNKMKLAGEAGSLLRIEEEIREVVREYTGQWGGIFAEQDEVRWQETEKQVIDALCEYANRAVGRNRLLRQLFADDAAQGLAFVDICRKRFEVVLMNPPFGYASEAVGAALDINRISDIDALFTASAIDRLLPNGFVGMITNRTQLLKPALADFRELILIEKSQIEICADLGNGVLDAMVETAAFTSRKKFDSVKKSFSVFISCLGNRDKEACINSWNCGKFSKIYFADCLSFLKLPDARFAYWLHPSFLQLLKSHTQLSDEQYVSFGLSTTDNFRFLRLRWEIEPKSICHYLSGKYISGWVPLAKGGEYSPYTGDIHLLVDWRENGASLREQPGAPIRNEELYGKPGLTYTKRTASAFSPRILPAGCIPEVNGTVIIPRSSQSHDSIDILTVCISRVASYLTDVLVAAGDTSFAFGAAKDYIPGVIGKLAIPKVIPEKSRSATRKVVDIKRILDSHSETSIEFAAPPTLAFSASSRFIEFAKYKIDLMVLASRLAAESDEALEKLSLLLPEDALEELNNVIGPLIGTPKDTELDTEKLNELLSKSTEEIVSAALARGQTRKDISKNSYRIDRRLELLAALLDIDITVCGDALIEEYSELQQRVAEEISFSVGVVFGLWDVRFGIDDSLISPLSDPFDVQPLCPRGMLIGSDGLPAIRGNIVSREWLCARPNINSLPPKGSVQQHTIPDSEYPIPVKWDGILVDDPDHPDDIIRRVQDVLQVIWSDKSEAIEKEACEILGIKDLRDYFRKPGNGGFWTDHIKRYSKSRRKAPIYWLLQSSKKNYALWIYYHRLDKDILFKALINYVEPKRRLEESNLEQLRSQKTAAGNTGKAAKQLEKQIDRQEALVSELHDFEEKLRRAANLNLEPDLNDGVVLNIAPLWELVPWNEAKKYWQELTAGKYEWSSIGKQLKAKGKVKC